MATPNKLTPEQREAVIAWLAAEYSQGAILAFLRERGWPVLDPKSIDHYRQSMREEIEQRRTERRSRALTTGLALKDERVERLKQHADRLEEIKWEPDEKGRLWNEKAWRETLDDIAREMGQRKAGVEVSGPDGGAIEFADVSTARAELAAEIARQSVTGTASGDIGAAPGADDCDPPL